MENGYPIKICESSISELSQVSEMQKIVKGSFLKRRESWGSLLTILRELKETNRKAFNC
jgi:hypothetical protein